MKLLWFDDKDYSFFFGAGIVGAFRCWRARLFVCLYCPVTVSWLSLERIEVRTDSKLLLITRRN
jgi:hypothetical protein